MEVTQNAKEVYDWDLLSDKERIERLRKELRVARDIVSALMGSVQRLRLQVQNHTHNDSTSQVLFPAGVFETPQSPISRYDPLA